MPARSDQFFAALKEWAEDAGRPVFVGEAHGNPAEPYAVLDPHWVSEPDVGSVMVDPAATYAGVTVSCYGLRTIDALWLDGAIYALYVDSPVPDLDVDVLYREGDSAPVLTFTDHGVMLARRWYRMTFR